MSRGKDSGHGTTLAIILVGAAGGWIFYQGQTANASSSWSGGTHSTASAYQLARDEGFSASGARTMAGIAGAESGFCTTAVGDQNIVNAVYGPSVGLWQARSVNADKGTGKTRDIERLADPVTNAKAARAIYKAQGFNAWGAYSSGKYQAFLGKPSATHNICPELGGLRAAAAPRAAAKAPVATSGAS
jgi:hypothetical protein